jgi:hypothetical protein
VLRVLEGASYWVIEDPGEIAELVNINVRREWEADIAEQEDHEEGKWLASLPRRKWRLEILPMASIKLNYRIMNYTNVKTVYDFRERLEERKRAMKDDMDRFGRVIQPLVVRAEDVQLMDGYCRYHVLLDKGVTKTYAYVGRL